MENITTSADLKQEIQILEAQQTFRTMQLREQFFLTYESLKPANLIFNTLNEIKSSPYLVNNVIDTSIGVAAGYLSRKAIIKESDSFFRKLFGAVLQFGVTNLVAQNPETIKSFGRFIFQQISRKKETNYTKL